jgi:AcrR family transcriptional regulator
MPRTEEQNQQLRDERQEQILQAALRVFARRGMAAAKIGDIAAEAGLSHGLVYHYFKSKDEMFTTLVRRALEGSVSVVRYACQQKGTPLEQLRWLTQMILQSIAGEGAFLFLLMIQAFTTEAVPDEVKGLLADGESSAAAVAIIPLLAAGQQAGEIIAQDPEKLADLYYSLIQGLAVSRTQRPDMPLPDADMVLRVLTVR